MRKYGTRERLYQSWHNMNLRCYDPNALHYADYGGRGISVCQEWRESFQCFLTWALENGYADNLTIDREDNNGNYEPGNCRWATHQTQQRNRRDRKELSAFGETKLLCEWIEDDRCNASIGTLWQRVAVLNWPAERAISEPTSAWCKKYSAFGETKLLGQWAKDPRCKTTSRNIRARMDYGWSFEDALTTPSLLPFGGRNQPPK